MVKSNPMIFFVKFFLANLYFPWYNMPHIEFITDYRIQSKNIQQNLNMLHKVALNIVRIYKRETQSKLALNGIMFRALMNPHDLLPLLDKN